MRSHFLLFFLLLSCGYAWGQPIYFRHYQVENGLANNTVFSVFQDSRQFMWFGTKEGLNRFDGSVFKTFNMLQDKQSDSREFVFCIAEGINNTLWVGTRKGLYEFNPKTETFTLLAHSKGREILNVATDGKGKIWFNADFRVFCYDEQTKKIRFYKPGLKRQQQISGLCMGNDHSVWAASTDGHLFRYSISGDRFQCLNATATGRRKTPGVSKISCTRSGDLLIGTTTGLSLFHSADTSYRHLLGQPAGQPPVFVRDMLPFTNDRYWVASETGIHNINIKNGKTEILEQDDSDPYSLSDNAVYALYRDTEGGIWCGTYFGGINYYHSQHGYFRKYFRKKDSHSLSGNAIRELCPDGNGNIWVGTEDAGLNKLDPVTGKVTQYPEPGLQTANNIHGLVMDDNHLWVGTFQRGLDIINARSGKRVRHYSANPTVNGLTSNFIISACKRRSGEILLGTSNGVFSYDRITGRFRLSPGFPVHSYVFSLIEDKNGLIWAGTIGAGLYYYNPKTGQKGNYRFNASDQQSVSSNSICGVFEDSKGRLWLSTEGGGLCLLNKNTGKFTRFNTRSGLPSNMVYKVLEDKKGRIWVSTSRGLAMHTPGNNDWKVYIKADGLLTDQFNYSSGYRDPNGILYFGSVKGLIAFDPEMIGNTESNPPIYITSFQVNNQELGSNNGLLKHAISFTDSINLDHQQSSVTIGFAALTYISSNTIRYQYRMDGLDSTWNTLTANRKVYFTKLKPGSYTFRIRSVNNKGQLQHDRRLFIRINPPWWQSSFAYIVYFIIIVSSIYLLISNYHRRQKERHRRRLTAFNEAKEKEIYKAKIDFFTNVAHEIRTPLTLIKGPLEMVMDEVGELPAIKNNLKNIERNTERLVKLTDQLLDFRRTENQGFSLSFVQASVSELVRENVQLFANAAAQRSLKLETDFPPRNFTAFVDIEAFHKIVGNLIGNAVKYAATHIYISVAVNPGLSGTFTVEISSDGPLIAWHHREKIFEPFFRINAMGEPGSGIGLPLARALTQLHNGVLELKQPDNATNSFVLTLPVHQKIEFKLKTVRKKST
ncbi:MAG: sensor histidine kinase [Sphingobacteriaceae bacterium]|nr:MAG: sensor histidine kinase [Sphingobacteriaceae bacterium]